MAVSRKQHERALDEAELSLVAQTRHPALRDTPDAALRDLARVLRDRRDRARDQKHRRRREARGKSEPRGATPAARYDGTKIKHGLLASAAARVNSEIERRRRMAAKTAAKAAMTTSARKALAMKQAADAENDTAFNSRHAHEGMRKIANRRAEDLINPMERGRLRKQQAVAQARRDAR